MHLAFSYFSTNLLLEGGRVIIHLNSALSLINNMRPTRERRKPGEWWKATSFRQIKKNTPHKSCVRVQKNRSIANQVKPSTPTSSSSRRSSILDCDRTSSEVKHNKEREDTASNEGVDYGNREAPEVDITGSLKSAAEQFGIASNRISPAALELSNYESTSIKRSEGRKSIGVNSCSLQRLQGTLIPRAQQVLSANRKSTKANTRQAQKVLQYFMQLHGESDPINVSLNSSCLVMNLIAKYCKFGTAESLKNDAMASLIQGLRIVYEEHGHIDAWSIRDGRASGNPLIGNRDITKLRRAHRIHLAHFGIVSLRARPLTAGIVCDHAAKFWHQNNDEDILLHAIFVVGLNLGLRFDEVSDLEMKFLSVTSNDITMRTSTGVKNQTSQRSYTIEDWPGDTQLKGSILMDPKVALLSWLTVRGARDGYIFCDVRLSKTGICKINPAKPLSSNRFSKLMRLRLTSIGIGERDVRMYSGHSIKRGAVQLYRSLGLKDEYIMKKVQMVGANAYLRYCEAFNDCAPEELPRFSGVQDYISHASRIHKERQMFLNGDEYAKYMAYILEDN